MSSHFEAVKQKALLLSGKDRAELASVLLDSLSTAASEQQASYVETLQTLKQALNEQGRAFSEFQTEFEAKHGL